MLVLFSAGANTAGNPNNSATDIINDLNTSATNSDLQVSDVSFSLAGVRLLSNFIESPSLENDVDDLVANQEAISHRNQTKADMVVLLTDNVYVGLGGRAKGFSVSNKNAYCISEIGSNTVNSTGTHEIGHLIGGRHQRCLNCTDGCDEMPNPNHGFVMAGNNTTVMATLACPGGRILNWSNPDVSVGGNVTGTTVANNARKIRKRAPKISCFQPNFSSTPTILMVSISGPSTMSYTNPYQWTATIQNTAATPVNYVWETSPNGFNNWTQVGTGSSFSTLNPNNFPCWFVIKITATDNNGTVGSAYMVVTRNPC